MGAILKNKRKVDPRMLRELIRSATLTAELLLGASNGQAKRAWVIKTINEAVDIPWMNEKNEGILIGALVDLSVDFFNASGWELPAPRGMQR